MRLLKHELKRILKTRCTFILLIASILFSALMAYLPMTYEYMSYVDENGNKVELKGMDAIQYKKNTQKVIMGSVTPKQIKNAVEKYRSCLSEYGVTESYELPENVYYERIYPYNILIRGVKEIFADPDTGIAKSVLEIETYQLKRYYDLCENWIVSLMKLEQRNNPIAQKTAVNMYENVEKPFEYYFGAGSNTMDYEILLEMMILIFCTVIAAPVFASDYQTGADDILRCTKYGRTKLGITKVVSALVICGIAFLFCMGIFIVISNSLFGWEGTKTSMQMIYSIVNLADWKTGELQAAVAAAGLLAVGATVSLTLFLSSKCRNVVMVLALGFVICIAPVIVYMMIHGNTGLWLRCILPSGAVGLQSSFLYASVDFEFLNIGKIAIWTPYAMIIFACVEMVLFAGLSVYSHDKHKIK